MTRYIDATQQHDPYSLYAHGRQTPGLMKEQLPDGRYVYIVTRYHDAVEVLDHPEVYSSYEALYPVVAWSPDTMEELVRGYPPTTIHINSDGAAHRRFRRPLSRFFSATRIAALEPSIRQRANALVDAFGSRVDIIDDFAYPLTIDIILELFHIPREDRARAKRWSDQWLGLVSAPLRGPAQVEAARGVVAYQRYLKDLIDQRRETPIANDILSVLLADQAQFSDRELIYVLGGVLLAGHETSTNMIGNGMRYCLTHREIWQQMCQSPESIPGYLEELLRLDTPASTFFRTTTRDVELSGTFLPANTLLLLMFGSVNRDEHFADPDRFCPGRSEKSLVFGRGEHFCLGAALARLEGKIAFEVLSKRMPDLHLCEAENEVRLPYVMFRGLSHVWATITQEIEGGAEC